MSELSAQDQSVNKVAQMQQFAEWLLMPAAARIEAGLPAKQKGMAELLGKSQATLSMWKKEDQFQRLVNRHVRSVFGADRLGAVIDALYDTATSGSSAAQVSAAKTLLGWYERSDTTIQKDELSKLSDDELEMLARRADAERADR
jgi:hypothetical protein